MIPRLLLLALVLCIPFRLGAQRTPVEARQGMVVSAHHLASRAGADIMRQGGNAIDAAVATGFALAVTYPRAGNLGGGGFMIVQTTDGATIALDFREVAPAAATRDMYLDEDGNVAQGDVLLLDTTNCLVKSENVLERSDKEIHVLKVLF